MNRQRDKDIPIKHRFRNRDSRDKRHLVNIYKLNRRLSDQGIYCVKKQSATGESIVDIMFV